MAYDQVSAVDNSRSAYLQQSAAQFNTLSGVNQALPVRPSLSKLNEILADLIDELGSLGIRINHHADNLFGCLPPIDASCSGVPVPENGIISSLHNKAQGISSLIRSLHISLDRFENCL